MAKWHESECSFGNNNNHNGISVSSNYFTFRFSELFYIFCQKNIWCIIVAAENNSVNFGGHYLTIQI